MRSPLAALKTIEVLDNRLFTGYGPTTRRGLLRMMQCSGRISLAMGIACFELGKALGPLKYQMHERLTIRRSLMMPVPIRVRGLKKKGTQWFLHPLWSESIGRTVIR